MQDMGLEFYEHFQAWTTFKLFICLLEPRWERLLRAISRAD